MTTGDELIFAAAAFAARAHRHQLRKDGATPYVSHPFRVCLVVRQVFGCDDPRVLAAALLHDTIEDTTTDYDDLLEQFGPDVARWVAALTKDMRLEHDPREAAYFAALRAAEWPVQLVKLADAYDNLNDCRHFLPAQRRRTADKAHQFLAAVADALPPEAAGPLRLVREKLASLEEGLTE